MNELDLTTPAEPQRFAGPVPPAIALALVAARGAEHHAPGSLEATVIGADATWAEHHAALCHAAQERFVGRQLLPGDGSIGIAARERVDHALAGYEQLLAGAR